MQNFQHKHSAHCESGVTSLLLKHKGLDVSEPFSFGIGSGLTFAYLPIVKISGMPLIAYRTLPKSIIKKSTKRLGVKLETQTFRKQQQAEDALDKLLDQGKFVGLQTSVYYLPYFPEDMRFHFNAHNLIVYGKEGNDYLISDPVFPEPVHCPAKDLQRARFASGALAPKGKMYYLSRVPTELDRPSLIVQGISFVCKMMLCSPFPLIGVKGITFLAGRLEKWPRRLGSEKADLHLGHVVRMQEEIGTGGGGFRFMYGAFLQECADEMQDNYLRDYATTLTLAGDAWRQFAVMAARICKNRADPKDTYPVMAGTIRQCASLEKQVFENLQTWVNEQR